MFETITNFFKKLGKQNKETSSNSKNVAKERLHLVLMQDRANVSADFLDLMKQEIIEVIKKYIDVDENAIDVRLTNKTNDDGTTGAPALYANIPIVSIKDEVKKENKQEDVKKENGEKEKKDEPKEEIEIKEEKVANNDKKEEVTEEASEVKEKNSDKKEESVEKPEVKENV